MFAADTTVWWQHAFHATCGNGHDVFHVFVEGLEVGQEIGRLQQPVCSHIFKYILMEFGNSAESWRLKFIEKINQWLNCWVISAVIPACRPPSFRVKSVSWQFWPIFLHINILENVHLVNLPFNSFKTKNAHIRKAFLFFLYVGVRENGRRESEVWLKRRIETESVSR